MPNAPNLLNDDGSASMATALMMSHHGLRRDTARFARALQAVAAGDHTRVDALKEEWQSYRATLHGHHEAEDKGLFPSLGGQQAALAPVIERLTADHRRIDPLLEEADRAFAGLPATTAAARAVVSQLSALLDPHLATEEAQLVPFLREAKSFPPPATEAEVELYAQGFAWSSHGIAEDVLARVGAMLPEALAAKLPAARVAFAARCERVWGPTQPGASRTAIPDWLPGG
jgi:hemerythrin-like domain-containing protein